MRQPTPEAVFKRECIEYAPCPGYPSFYYWYSVTLSKPRRGWYHLRAGRLFREADYSRMGIRTAKDLHDAYWECAEACDSEWEPDVAADLRKVEALDPELGRAVRLLFEGGAQEGRK